ncbi:MAG: hypothetical protein IJ424_05535 [Oscillospiraceae bacterium]|nr:hypothetical protein [Oscillospiraceae bacterium]
MKKANSKLWLKITSIILFVVFLAVFAASVFGVIALGYMEVYFDGGKNFKESVQQDYAYSAVSSIAYEFKEYVAPEWYQITKEKEYQGDTWEYDPESASYQKKTEGITFNSSDFPYTEPENYFGGDMVGQFFSYDYAEGRTNYAFEIKDVQSGEVVFANFTPPADYVDTITHTSKTSALGDLQKINLQFESRYDLNRYLKDLKGGLYNSTIYFIPKEGYVSDSGTPSLKTWVIEADYIPIETKNYEITLYIPQTYPVQNAGAVVMSLVDFAIAYRYLPIITGAASLVLLLIIFIYLMCAAGCKAGAEGITPNWIDKIPFDLYLIILAVIVCVIIELSDVFDHDLLMLIYLFCAGVLLALLFISLCMTTATRAKLGTVLSNTVIGLALVLLVKILKAVFKFVKKIFSGICYAFANLKFVWRAVIICVLIAAFEIFTIFFIVEMYWMRAFWVFVFLFGNLFLATMTVFYLIAFFKIKKCIKELANGNSYAKVDSQYVFGIFKECADDLNNIGMGIQKAVEESMKSERLKTELITNVSHDLKTPLTSIVNYIDILSKEDIQPEEAKEHVNVLVRQSQRMKKLIDDLIEASKASTGATNVELTRSDLSMLLSQSVVEYEDRFNNSNLAVKMILPENPLVALLDGKLMWRVFDNLLGNIYKYAQPGTRVYITAVEKGDDIVVSFKNISKYELNISSNELMERFVRGDSSRSTEGSGLGLSIARSLCDLQNATLDIDIDGDLFKVNITVKKLGDEELINE